jgi:5,10-methylenetetrahydromethanopterin reductase
MQLSCALAPGPDTPAHAKLAETLGYERVWLFDSPALYTDIWISLARVAEATERIGLGTGVLVPSLRAPITTASAIAGIEMIAPGRLAVAIGTGFTARMMLGQKPLTWKFTEDYIRTLRGLLQGETVEIDGGMVRLSYPDGYGPRPPFTVPILVAANGPKGLDVAKRLGDGVMCVAAPQPGFGWCSMLTLGTVLDEDEDYASDRAFDALGPGIAAMYHGTYEAAGAGVDNLPGGREWREEIEDVPEAVRHLTLHADHMIRVTELDRRFISRNMGAALFTGTADALRAKVSDLEAAGLTEILYAPAGSDIPRELSAMAKALG